MLHHPSSPLFPYTTLFRSRWTTGASRSAAAPTIVHTMPREHSRPGPECSRGDRKSTRLNSSHSSISYAVFCLKKKKHVVAGDKSKIAGHILKATLLRQKCF